jgi:hypothetical protein
MVWRFITSIYTYLCFVNKQVWRRDNRETGTFQRGDAEPKRHLSISSRLAFFVHMLAMTSRIDMRYTGSVQQNKIRES